MKFSFLITHYNRPEHLANCIDSILNQNISDKFEIVISDDCSEEQVLQKISSLNIDQLITSQENTGLASNINRGVKACRGKFIIYVQEDFILKSGFNSILNKSADFIKNEHASMVRFTSSVKFYSHKTTQNEFKLIPRFSIKNFFIEHFRYSDNPFIVRRSFFEEYGQYKDYVSTNFGECEYMVRMMKLNPKIALCENFYVEHKGDEDSIREENKIIVTSSWDLKNKFRVLKRTETGKRILRKLKPIKVFFNGFRFKIEYLHYNVDKRDLLTFKNLRS